MIRISTIISFGLILAILMSWAVFFKSSIDEFALWRRGETGVVMPIDKYVNKATGTKQTQPYYVATLNVRLNSGEIVTIPKKPVTLARIEESRHKQFSLVFLRSDPETNRFVGERRGLIAFLLASLGFSVLGWLWFRRSRS
ncbi:MAG: hypothetical protein RLZZ618_905 [Pseudomonadota bacterium]|jgi:hypothetical protein